MCKLVTTAMYASAKEWAPFCSFSNVGTPRA